MAKATVQPQAQLATPTSGNIPLPAGGFTPSATRSHGISHALKTFFSAAWEQYQKENKDACITNVSLVRALRLSWYPYLEKQGYNRNTASVVSGDWYKVASRNMSYIRDPEVLKRRSK